MFASLTVSVLKQIIKEFNLHTHIKGVSKMKKPELVAEIEKHLTINSKGEVIMKNDHEILYKAPKTKKSAKKVAKKTTKKTTKKGKRAKKTTRLEDLAYEDLDEDEDMPNDEDVHMARHRSGRGLSDMGFYRYA